MNHRNVKVVFGSAVREKRLELGFSQEDLAEAWASTARYVSDMERGIRNISMESIERLPCPGSFPSRHSSTAQAVEPTEATGEILLVEDNLHDLKWCGASCGSDLQSHHIARNSTEALEFLFGDGTVLPPASRAQVDPRGSGTAEMGWLSAQADEERSRLDNSGDRAHVVTKQTGFCKDTFGREQLIVKPVTFERFVEAVQQLGWQWMLLDQRQHRRINMLRPLSNLDR